MTAKSISPETQAGSVLLEALVAVLIFSFGLLAMISMQSAAVRSTTDAKYRADAAFLANQIIAHIWSNSSDVAAMGNFANGVSATSAGAEDCPVGAVSASNAAARAWLDAVSAMLPGADAGRQQVSVSNNVDVDGDGVADQGVVMVRICWADRSSPSSDPTYHNYLATARINKNF